MIGEVEYIGENLIFYVNRVSQFQEGAEANSFVVNFEETMIFCDNIEMNLMGVVRYTQSEESKSDIQNLIQSMILTLMTML